MKITEARLRQILREESHRVRLFEAPAAPAAAPAPAAGLIPLVNGKPVGGRFMLGNQTALQKYSPNAEWFLLPNGEFKSFGEMCREIGEDIDRGGTEDSGGVTLIESGAYYIGLAGYKSPTLDDLRTNSGKELEGTELSNVLNLEEEDEVNGQDFFQRFNMAFDAGMKDRKMPGGSPAAQPAAGAPTAGAPTAGATSKPGIKVIAEVQELQKMLGVNPQDGKWGPATQAALEPFLTGLLNKGIVEAGGTVYQKGVDVSPFTKGWAKISKLITKVNNAAPVPPSGWSQGGFPPTVSGILSFIKQLQAPAGSVRPAPAPGVPAAEGSWRRGTRVNESERRVRIAWGR